MIFNYTIQLQQRSENLCVVMYNTLRSKYIVTTVAHSLVYGSSYIPHNLLETSEVSN